MTADSGASQGCEEVIPPSNSPAVATAPKSRLITPSFVQLLLLAPVFCQRLAMEPDRCQILVEVVAGADLPAFHIGMMWDNAVPPEQEHLVRLDIEHMLLEGAHQGALFGEVGLAPHLV